MAYVDRINVNNNGIYPILGVSGDRYYRGTDLTSKFASELTSTDPAVWIKQRINAAEQDGYTGIHVNDYIPFTCTNGNIVKACIAGIDTYTGYGDTAVGHHIDFISRDCWPTTVQFNLANYNNGLIPVETLTGDGVKTAFVMTRQMDAIATVTIAGTATTAYTYDLATSTITFATAPASGAAVVVTGTGSQHPWLASNAYAYLNSLAMAVPNGTALNPAITRVDYTAGGVWHYLPATLKSVIADKRILLPIRYSASGLLVSDNIWEWANMGKLWLPSEVEITGAPVWSNSGYSAGGFVQYPIFAQNANRVKGLGDGGSRSHWWTISTYAGYSTYFVYVGNYGHVYTNVAAGTQGVPVCFRIEEDAA